jgi:hypothetical protein
MMRALVLCGWVLALAGFAVAARAAEEKAKNPECPFLELNGVSMIDDRTAILDMSTRVDAAPQNRRWFKVTFRSNCKWLRNSHFFTLEGVGCPRRGHVVVFSRRPSASDEDTDRCTIDSAEEIPVRVGAAPQL